ncbi:MAG TPA: M23 family metallopeptidase, partial [bacterium]|nr:M23 family metallopeptidase [bacterium]
MQGRTKVLVIVGLTFLTLTPFVLIRLGHRKTARYQQPAWQTLTGQIKTGETLVRLLTSQGVDAFSGGQAVNELKKVFDVRRCQPGATYEIILDREGRFLRLFYQDDPLYYYVVWFNKETGGYTAEKKEIEAKKMRTAAAGEIKSSLYESMGEAGVPAELVMQFAEAFASKIDFFADCQAGDRFALLWECYQAGGQIVKHLNLIAGIYQRGETVQRAFYFEGDFYDEKGNSVESAFLKAPLSYRRISSFFSHRRLHPVTGIYRPHLGIDYAAATGTPVSAIGDGRVIFQGWTTNGYGKAVQLKHPNGYVSYYGHLSAIARGMATGKRVKKGQVIGYVGSTGCSTGPHLDFRLKRNGQFVNPLSLKMPPGRSVRPERMGHF